MTVAAVAAAFAGTSVSAPAQVGDGSIGTVQASLPPVDVVAGTDDGVSVAASGAPSSTSDQPGQTATSSVGTVQARTPQVDARAEAAPSTDGPAISPATSLGVASGPGDDEPQKAGDSIGTVQMGGGAEQVADGSLGTAQVSQPGATVEGSVVGPLRPDMPDGLATPDAELAAAVTPADGSQATSDSTGTVQVGSGAQSTDDSVGAAQAALPSARLSTSGGGAEPTSTDASAALAWGAGGQRVGRSIGTAQVGGGGQSVDDSLGTAQLGAPDVTAGTSEPEAADSSTTLASPGTVAAQPVARRDGRAPQTVDAVAPAPAAAPADAPGGGTLEATGATPLAGTLPFTGLVLSAIVLLAIALSFFGVLLRRGANAV